jgi:5-methylcytosine-specific restriction endonuclease McrA
MKRIAKEIETTELCSYGCGHTAKYKNGSGKLMCCTRSNSCPAVKAKNSNSLISLYSEGKRDAKKQYKEMTQEQKDRMSHKNVFHAVFEKDVKLSSGHKKALIFERGHKCEECNLTEWRGKPITLELEHIDPDTRNNTRENLKLLCPNCHSLTPTWKIGNSKGWKLKIHSDEDIIAAVEKCENLHQALKELGLKYGSAGTVIDTMSKYKVSFKKSN